MHADELKGMARIGIDVGGTFTDGVIATDGAVTTAKVPSRPDDVAGAILECCDRLSADLSQVSLLIHGTTIATNAIIEKSAAPIAHVTTAGYRDVLHIRRADSKSYNLTWEPPAPVVRRRDIYEVPERLGWDGSVITDLDEEAARRVARIISEKGYQAVSVVFLHSYRDPVHEVRMREILEEACPGIEVSISADVLPHYREFERSSTTAVNAYLTPLMASYLEELKSKAADKGLPKSPLIMQSNGGVMTVEEARRLPARTARSGPAGGAIAATQLADSLGQDDAIMIDMGGTSTEVAVRHRSQLRWTPQIEFSWGVPIRFPSVEIHSIGAGGGSVAWVESGRFLKVGPQSAGADPGPACYGKGGELPTTTDAQVVLGRLNPDSLLDGAMPIERELAARAITEHVAKPLGMTLEEAARGILRVTTNNTMQAIRLMTTNRGLDPRDSSLIAYGGNGPLYAADVANLLEIERVIVPAHSGVTSAYGMVQADFEYDETVTLLAREADLDLSAVTGAFRELETELTGRLAAAGIPEPDRKLLRHMDMRYDGQGYELSIEAPDGEYGEAELAELKEAFHAQHHREFGWRQDDWPVELVFARVLARGEISGKPDMAGSHPAARPDGEHPRPVSTRLCHFLDAGDEPVETPIYRREAFEAGRSLPGPAVIEQMDTTTIIPPGYAGEVDPGDNLILARARKEGNA